MTFVGIGVVYPDVDALIDGLPSDHAPHLKERRGKDRIGSGTKSPASSSVAGAAAAISPAVVPSRTVGLGRRRPAVMIKFVGTKQDMRKGRKIFSPVSGWTVALRTT
jgi:hypothetical protein